MPKMIKLSPNKYCFGLLTEVLIIIVAKEAAKLRQIKVKGLNKTKWTLVQER